MKRFYREVSIAQLDAGWQVQLDQRPVKTVGGAPQITPTRALAEALAAEWAGQAELIEPGSLVLRDLADFAIDCILPDQPAAIAALLRYAETDTLCYRAEPDEPLAARQLEVWEPLLCRAEARWDVHFERVAGVLHKPQPGATLDRLYAVLATLDPFRLSALNTLASLAASLVIGLAALEPDATAAPLWDAANLEEDWQAEHWGQDGGALALRTRRLELFEAALRFGQLAQA